MSYTAPTIMIEDPDVDNEFLGVVAAFLGVSVAYVGFVCNACGWSNCRSFWSTVGTVKDWWGPGC